MYCYITQKVYVNLSLWKKKISDPHYKVPYLKLFTKRLQLRWEGFTLFSLYSILMIKFETDRHAGTRFNKVLTLSEHLTTPTCSIRDFRKCWGVKTSRLVCFSHGESETRELLIQFSQTGVKWDPLDIRSYHLIPFLQLCRINRKVLGKVLQKGLQKHLFSLVTPELPPYCLTKTLVNFLPGVLTINYLVTVGTPVPDLYRTSEITNRTGQVVKIVTELTSHSRVLVVYTSTVLPSL